MDAPEGTGKPDLFAKAGPLPVWAWAAVVVAAYLVYRKMQAGKAASLPLAVADPYATAGAGPASPGTNTGTSAAVDPTQAGYNYSSTLDGSYGGSVAGSGTNYSTNQGWLISVISLMVKMGYPAGATTTALTMYLAGGTLSAHDATIVNAAITNFGPPPLPLPLNTVPDVGPLPAPAPAPAPAPPGTAQTGTPVDPPKQRIFATYQTPESMRLGDTSYEASHPEALAPNAVAGLYPHKLLIYTLPNGRQIETEDTANNRDAIKSYGGTVVGGY